MSTIANVLDRLQRVRPIGDGKHQALCPAHEDRNASLSVSPSGVSDDAPGFVRVIA